MNRDLQVQWVVAVALILVGVYALAGIGAALLALGLILYWPTAAP